nr:c-type cytochrome biogenesis protein CcmI [Tahibacter harae]
MAGLMLLAALACVLLPLLRHDRGGAQARQLQRRRALDEALAAGVINAEEHAAKRAALDAETTSADAAPPRTRGAFVSALLTLLLLPAGAIALYLSLGNVHAMDPVRMAAAAAAEGQAGPDMQAAVEGLLTKLKASPDDVEGWMLLGRSYKAMERFADARDALKNAYDRAPDNADVQVDYAEALALAGENRRIQGQARELLERALKSTPDHQRALWLLGIAEYQQQNYAAAVDFWERLRTLLPPQAEARASLENQIADARQRGGLVAGAGTTPATGAAQTGAETAAAGAAPAAKEKPASQDASAPAGSEAADAIRIAVEVSLDPKLREQAPAGASLFVFARAASGPPMPLAVQRLSVSDLPAKVVLTEEMGMLPNMKLSQFPQVVVGARISASGNPRAQSGDLQTLSAPVDVKTRAPVRLVIDQVVP